MGSTVDDIRRKYALAYLPSLLPDWSVRPDDDPVRQYVSWWCREYGPDMGRIVLIAQVALTNLSNGTGTEIVRSCARRQIMDAGSEAVRTLLDRIEPLRSVFLSDAVDDSTFRRTMELIVKAFGQSTS